MENEEEVEEEEVENLLIDVEVEVQIDFQITDLHQDLKNETIIEAHMVKKEMMEKDLLATEEVIVAQLQDLKNETTIEAHMVKKAVNPLSSERNLEVSKRNLSKNLQRNLLFN